MEESANKRRELTKIDKSEDKTEFKTLSKYTSELIVSLTKGKKFKNYNFLILTIVPIAIHPPMNGDRVHWYL